MNILDYISESLETNFWVKILKFFDADPEIFLTLDPGSGNLFDPGSGIGKIRIWDPGNKHPGGTLIPIKVS
jgi:hypothetical protein